MSKKIIIILVLIILGLLLLVPVPAKRGRVVCKIGGKCPPSNAWYLKKPVGWQVTEVLYHRITQSSRVNVERFEIR